MTEAPPKAKLLEAWFWLVATMIVVMVIVGGATRLTGSGLSITEWDLVSGFLPPLTAASWNEVFALYQASPEYQLQNHHFTLTDFKAIFWWEWAHRFIGRVLGLVLAAPLIVFWFRGGLTPWARRRGAMLFGLISFQGFLGWFMVASGLVDVPRVSHFRLAAHLTTAFFTFAFTLWSALELRNGARSPRAGSSLPLLFLAALAVQITWGAFVAGLDAGLYHPTWPRMTGHWLPPGTFDGGASSAINHPVAVQFIHRTLGTVLVPFGLYVAHQLRREGAPTGGVVLFAAALIGQFALGVATILHFVSHPVTLGVTHQFGALVLLGATTNLLFQTRTSEAQR